VPITRKDLEIDDVIKHGPRSAFSPDLGPLGRHGNSGNETKRHGFLLFFTRVRALQSRWIGTTKETRGVSEVFPRFPWRVESNLVGGECRPPAMSREFPSRRPR
jgi:hypothetical protein